MQITKFTQSNLFNDLTISKRDRYERSTESLMGAKAFKERTGLTGQAAKRGYAEYLRKAGKSGAVGMAGMVQSGGLLLTKIRETKDGWNATYVRPETVEPKLGGKRSRKLDTSGLQAMTSSELEQVLASAQAELAKR